MNRSIWRERLFETTRGQILALLHAEPRTVNDLTATMREVGHALAHEHVQRVRQKSRRERLAAALDVIRSLGGASAALRVDGQKIIRGNTCPLAAVTVGHPSACHVVETLLSDITGLSVTEHCTRGQPPSCCFEIG